MSWHFSGQRRSLGTSLRGKRPELLRHSHKDGRRRQPHGAAAGATRSREKSDYFYHAIFYFSTVIVKHSAPARRDVSKRRSVEQLIDADFRRQACRAADEAHDSGISGVRQHAVTTLLNFALAHYQATF